LKRALSERNQSKFYRNRWGGGKKRGKTEKEKKEERKFFVFF